MLTFNADGTFSWWDESSIKDAGSWILEGDQLTLMTPVFFTYSASGQTLVWERDCAAQLQYWDDCEADEFRFVSAGSGSDTGITGVVTDGQSNPLRGAGFGIEVPTDPVLGSADPLSLSPGRVILVQAPGDTSGVFTAPAAFTPNGDGVNDQVRIEAEDMSGFTLRDASGDVVREVDLGTTSGLVALAWDGRDSDGLLLTEGQYRAEVTFTGGGSVTFDVASILPTVADLDGGYTLGLPPGAWTIGVSHETEDSYYSATQTVTVPVSGFAEVNWTLSPE